MSRSKRREKKRLAQLAERRRLEGVPEPIGPIKVRLDKQTVITLASKRALAFWKERYPNLTIID